jgi:host factor-I protein|tara:strand:+ start:1425 stop:1631 length:207 start_codon:yes stop_codon:yes gene_type:complete
MKDNEAKFIQTLIDGNAQVTIFLINGVKLSGEITSADEETLNLKRDKHTQLVYKNAISTIMPIDPIQL